MSLFEVLIKGGWMMIPVGLSSIVVFALGINRFIALRRERFDLDRFVSNWSVASVGEDTSRFVASCKVGPKVASKMVEVFSAGLSDRRDIAQGMETTGRQELFRMESGLGTMGTLAAATPLMGFLGTVTGMIRAFMQIQNLGGNVNANVLAGGIWEALVTTAAGLAVGILALIIHNYLAGVVRELAKQIEQIGDIITRQMGSQNEA